ncbi:MAG TPA: hypothetical protein PK781_05055, partial [Terrimesophilobacter sp.]|nr:hypothetical protein [Terrimesophilobacter sp.]
MRYETDQLLAQRNAPTAAAAPAAPQAAATVAAPPVVPEPAPIVPPAAPPSEKRAPTAAAVDGADAGTTPRAGQAAASVDKPRRSSVQVSLLVVGVSLLSIAAIFFLVYAF